MLCILHVITRMCEGRHMFFVVLPIFLNDCLCKLNYIFKRLFSFEGCAVLLLCLALIVFKISVLLLFGGKGAREEMAE